MGLNRGVAAMASAGDAFYNPTTHTRIVFVQVPADTGGASMVVDWYVPPGERLPAARHYHAGPDGVPVERFEVLHGVAGCRVGRAVHSLGAGDRVDIPFNVTHVHPWNVSDTLLHVRQSSFLPEPDLKVLTGVERFFETLVALSQQGKATRRGDIRNPLQSALTLHETLIDPTFLPVIPRGVQKRVFARLAAIARRRGYRGVIAPEPDRSQS
jgi:hypothetical protein